MEDNLVIVESPAKAKTIEKFLGKGFKVMSSYGHIRDLKKHSISIDEQTMQPVYEIPDDKKKVVSELKRSVKTASQVWLASDEDREGEAISWHLCEVLGLDEDKTNRIVFHEITRPAILRAIENPRKLDMNLVNAQQARRVLDRLVGFKLSPVLWRKVKPSLSAGRVQSVAVRLVVEQEREIQRFRSEVYFRIVAVFMLRAADGRNGEVKARLERNFKTHEEALAFLEQCRNAQFTVESVQKKPAKSSSPSPFTTSTLQQEAARKLGFTVSQTMMVAQRLYENGLITYMRTDSVNLSSIAINAGKEVVTELYGERYSNPHNYHTHAKGAQEAHEAIRPTDMAKQRISGTTQEVRLYDLIWKRTIASQMADSIEERTTVNIAVSNNADLKFVATGDVIVFDGYKKVYMDTKEDGVASDNFHSELPVLNTGDLLERVEVQALERHSQCPARYTEGSLVRKLEELGIGRPSTYAPTISTIQQREYVVKGDKKGEERTFIIETLKDDKITQSQKKEYVGSEKGKLLPTDVGIVVNDFLMDNFPEIMDYNFTAHVENEFDKIAEGEQEWIAMMKKFDQDFEPVVERVLNTRSEHKAGERQLGIDPVSGHPVLVKIGRFGPLVQIGLAADKEKPRFAQLPKNLSIETITLDEALELFKLPRTLGDYEGSTVTIGTGRFGPYVLHNKVYSSVPKGMDPMTITLDEAVAVIEEKRKVEREKHISKFEQDENLQVLKGRFGPYISYNGDNYRIDKKLHETALAGGLTYEQCMEIVNTTPATNKSSRRKK